MTQRTDIANLALGWIGAANISSVEDDSEEARQILYNYAIARDATLEEHEWTFAIKRFVPSPVTEEPAWGYSYKYRVPSEILRVLTVGPDKEIWWNYDQDHWELEGGFILCDEATIFCRGIERVEEEGRFSNLFVHALAAKLAALIALPLTSSSTIQQTMLQMYAGFIRDAKSRDGQQGKSKRLRKSSIHSVR